MTETPTEHVTRESQIVYLTEWAARYRCSLQLGGEVGFGRPCVGILRDSTYIDTEDAKNATAYNHESEPGSWWEPEDSYHKHDCLAVLDHGDPEAALGQLYAWVKWLDEHGWGVEVVYREPSSNIDLALHGISTPKLVKLPSP
jgi:hypothetical protein